MKRLSTWLLIATISMLLIGCTTEAEEKANLQKSEGDVINGMTPDQVAVLYQTAKIQKNLRRQMALVGPELLDKVTHGVEDLNFKKDFGPENQNSIKPDYKLTEYKFDDNTFFYQFENTDDDSLFNFPYKIVRTPRGWKVVNDASDEFLSLYKSKGVTYKGEHLKERGLSEEEIEKIRKTRFYATNIKKTVDVPVHENLIKEILEEDIKADTVAKEKYRKYFSPSAPKVNGVTPAEIAKKALQAEVDKDYQEFQTYITPEVKKKYSEGESWWNKIDWNSTGKEDPGELKVIEEALGKDQSYYYKVTHRDWSWNIYKFKKLGSNWKIVETHTEWKDFPEKLDVKKLKFHEDGTEIKDLW
ncbi:hypothetical protein [Hazenella coriacea]|uniref:Lipoprotein n=1 Tax=Hazenella coriacea TaxID=1179467 RepID=A0A4R3L248_9BACL|nr:hypothetical protein [Hazenella coriacea]TCS93252.1 hypothetical protein EDD58_10866 [Hazenella coriacea]